MQRAEERAWATTMIEATLRDAAGEQAALHSGVRQLADLTTPLGSVVFHRRLEILTGPEAPELVHLRARVTWTSRTGVPDEVSEELDVCRALEDSGFREVLDAP